MSDPKTVAINLRPERIRAIAGTVPEGLATFAGTVEDTTFFGPNVAQAVRLASGRLLEIRSQRSGHDVLPAPGEAIKLAFDPADVAPLAAD